MKHSLWVAALLGTVGTTGFAEQGQMSAGLGLSTVGPQLQLGYKYSNNIGFRGFFAGGISESRSQTESDIKYDAKANLGGIGLLVDYYPMNNGLKLSGGLFKSNTDITMKSTITAPTTVGNTSYTSCTIDGKVEFARDVSPMIAVGYDYNLGSNWTLGAELGAILNDGFKATATATGPITQADLDAEMKDLQDALSSTKMLPYISVMATYRF